MVTSIMALQLSMIHRAVRWMGVLNLEGKTPETLKRHLIVNVNDINKAINYGVKVRFLERDEFNLFLDLYRETEERAGFVSKQMIIFITLLTHMEIKY